MESEAKVGGINTVFYSAGVIYLIPLRDRTNMEFVGVSVCEMSFTLIHEGMMAGVLYPRSEQPACVSLFGVVPESIFDRSVCFNALSHRVCVIRTS